MRFDAYITENLDSLDAFDKTLHLVYQMNVDHLELLRDFVVKRIREWEQELKDMPGD
jgi:hypothetical protein